MILPGGQDIESPDYQWRALLRRSEAWSMEQVLRLADYVARRLLGDDGQSYRQASQDVSIRLSQVGCLSDGPKGTAVTMRGWLAVGVFIVAAERACALEYCAPWGSLFVGPKEAWAMGQVLRFATRLAKDRLASDKGAFDRLTDATRDVAVESGLICWNADTGVEMNALSWAALATLLREACRSSVRAEGR